MDNSKNSVLSSVSARENVFLRKVYLWMASALVLTGACAYLVASSEKMMMSLHSNPVLLAVLVIAEFAFVFILSGRVESLSQGSAFFLFYGYSALNGVMLSSVVYLYSGSNILPLAFATTAAVFVAASLYGVFTKRSIKGWGGWLSMALIALVVVSLVNMLLKSSSLDYLISIVGVVLFSLITAWDTKKITSLNAQYGDDIAESDLNKISLLGALELYLDFINILLYLIRIYARSSRRD